MEIGNKISEFEVFNFNNKRVKKVKFIHDYFNLDGQTPNSFTQKEDIRLMLKGLEIYGETEEVFQKYNFEYNRPDDLPSRSELSVDWLGYNNGYGNNVLYPSYNDGTKYFSGANRNFVHSKAKIGILERIDYPTGGFTEFQYGPHYKYGSEETVSNEGFAYADVNSLTQSNIVNYGNCDDEFVGRNPKILIQEFEIPNSGAYSLNFNILQGEGQLMIVKLNATKNCKTNADNEEICEWQVAPHNFDNYCSFYNLSNYWFNNNSSYYQNFSFDEGVYAFMLLSAEDDISNFSQATMSITQEVINVTYDNLEIGGLRIDKITSYEAVGSFGFSKEYDYNDKDGKSTASVNYLPNFIEFQSHIELNGSNEKVVYELKRTATFPQGDQPYVVYDEVKEINKDNSGNALGYVKNNFYKGKKGSVPDVRPPFASNYWGNLKPGEISEKQVYHENGSPLTKQEIGYFEAGDFGVYGIVVSNDRKNLNKRAIINKNTVPSVIEYVIEYPCVGPYQCANPWYINNPDYTVLGWEYRMLDSYYSIAYGTQGGISEVKETKYFKEGSGPTVEVKTSTLTEYDATVDYLSRKTEMVDSHGDVFETKYFYPKDYLVNGSVDLVAKNNLVAQMRTVTTKNPGTATSKEIQKKEVEYVAVVNGIVLPDKIRLEKGGSGLTDLGTFEYYDNGNLKTSKIEGGPPVTYIWGYNKQYVVARIENASYSQVESILGSGFDLGPMELSEAQADDLRSGLANAHVTTYTYDPLIGVTSETDPRGYTIYYHYDAFNRLKEVKDAKGNIVTDYKYHYKGQTN